MFSDGGIFGIETHSVDTDDMLGFYPGEGELVSCNHPHKPRKPVRHRPGKPSQIAGEQRRLPDRSLLFTDHTRHTAQNAGAGARGTLDIKQG